MPTAKFREFGLSSPLEGLSVDKFFELETFALASRMTTQPTTQRKRQIDTLVRALKLAGVWSKLDAFYVLAAADAQAARLNWIANAYNLALGAAPVFTADRGYAGNGVDAWLDAGSPLTAMSKYLLNDATMGVWSRTAAAGLGIQDIGTSSSTTASIVSRSAGGNIVSRSNSSTGANSAVVDGLGLSAWSRSVAGTLRPYRNGVPMTPAANASVAVPAGNFSILRSSTNFTDKQIAGGFVGGSLSDAEHAALYAALSTYMVAVGAA